MYTPSTPPPPAPCSEVCRLSPRHSLRSRHLRTASTSRRSHRTRATPTRRICFYRDGCQHYCGRRRWAEGRLFTRSRCPRRRATRRARVHRRCDAVHAHAAAARSTPSRLTNTATGGGVGGSGGSELEQSTHFALKELLKQTTAHAMADAVPSLHAPRGHHPNNRRR
jgi:hypothetical protein